MAREPDRDTVHCTLRLPDNGLERRIKKLAARHGRSMNAELVYLLHKAVLLEEMRGQQTDPCR